MEPLIGLGSLIRAGAALLCVSLPGFALLGQLGVVDRLSRPFSAGLAVVASLAVHLLLTTGLALAGLPFGVYFYVALGLAALSLPFAIRTALRGERWNTPWVIAFALLVFGALSTRPVTVRSDAVDHIGTVRAILVSGELEPNDVFYSEGDGVKPDIRKGYYHAWLALLARVSALDPVAFWYALRPWALFLAVLVFAGLAERLLSSRRRALAALVAFPLFVHGNAASFMDTILYPHNFKWMIVWVVLALMLDELATRSRGRFAILLVVTAALPTLHIFGPAILLLAAFSVPIALAILRSREGARRGLGLSLVVLAASVPLVVLRFLQTYRPLNPLHVRASEIFYVTDFLQLHTPGPTLNQFSLPALVIVVLSFPFLWRRDERTQERAVLAGLTWIPLLVSFNPVAGGILLPWMGYLFVRFLGIIPFPIVAAAIAADAWCRAPRRVFGRWVPIAAVVLLAAFRVPPFLATASGEMRARDRSMSPERWRDGIDLIRRWVPQGETVATDPVTGYALGAYTRHRIVALLDQHTSPADTSILDRLRDVACILSPYRPLSEAVELMNRRGARYVFLNQTFRSPFATYFDVRLPEEYARVRERFEVAGGPFRKLGETDRCHLYALADTAWADSALDARFRFPLSDLAAPTDSTDVRPLTDALALLNVEVEPRACRRGDTLTVTVRMRKERADPPGTPYKMVLRARKEFTGRHSRWRQVDRLYSRVVGKAGGSQLEFAAHRPPLDGRYPPNLWDVGETVTDRFRFPVPKKIEPGVYQMGIWVHPRSYVRNIALADLVKPSGGIGLPVGELLIHP